MTWGEPERRSWKTQRRIRENSASGASVCWCDRWVVVRTWSAAATCQGQDAGLAVCVVWNLDGRFADSLLIQDLTPRLDAGFQEIQLCGCEFEVVSGRLVDVPGVDDQVEAVEAQ